MQNALIITAVGMGLVFVSIVILWGLMELLVKFAADKEKPQSEPQEPAESEPAVAPQTSDKQKIAALAVAVALQTRKQQAAGMAVKIAMQQNAGLQSSASGTQAPISNWQAVRRAGQFEVRNNLFLRKPRGIKK